MVITLKLNSYVRDNGFCNVYFNVSNGKSGEINQVRKRIYKNLEVNPKQFDKKNFRAKPKHPNQAIINQAISKFTVLGDWLARSCFSGCLVELGADVSARDRWDKTPRTVAEEGGKQNAAEFLASVGAPTGGEAPPSGYAGPPRDGTATGLC